MRLTIGRSFSTSSSLKASSLSSDSPFKTTSSALSLESWERTKSSDDDDVVEVSFEELCTLLLESLLLLEEDELLSDADSW